MLPYISIAGKPIPLYSLCGITGFLAGLLYLFFYFRKDHKSREDAIYVYVLAMIGAILGAKILYLLTVFPQFLQDLPLLKTQPRLFIHAYFSGGLVMYGGLFGAILSAWLSARYFDRKFSDLIPALLPAFILITAFGRLGCFFAGCCYGKPTNLPIGLIFPPGSFAPAGIPLLPVQLFEAAFDFLLFIVFARLSHKERIHPYLLPLYIFTYSSFRFIIEFYRGDAIRGFWGPLSTSQWIAIAAIIGVGTYFIQFSKSSY